MLKFKNSFNRLTTRMGSFEPKYIVQESDVSKSI